MSELHLFFRTILLYCSVNYFSNLVMKYIKRVASHDKSTYKNLRASFFSDNALRLFLFIIFLARLFAEIGFLY